MKNSAKFTVIVFFGVFMLALILNSACGKATSSGAIVTGATPTPASAAPAKPDAAPAGGKEIEKSFTLAKDSQSEYGEAVFNHENHAFKNYSPDGKSVMGCVECHHTDQPKSALKAPYVTSERDTALTIEVYKASAQKVSNCRTCHFQDGQVPDGKEMPKTTKDLTNELAYHINCNGCHDAAFKARPELKSKPGFATSKDCTICHKKN
ncbi:MAG TPA: cytochrome c3 family protein [Pyrinomonadaceae bacterium]|nr:cytochrome c3 family protein [Pyrinomonadaceae bacterium]